MSLKSDQIFKRLKREYPDAKTELNYSSAWELLVATILSAQCTDLKVNEVTARLFKEFKTPGDFVKNKAAKLETVIKPTGFFRQKAKSLRGTAQAVLDHHGGEVPTTIEELTKLPGVGRKTANVVLGNAFGIPGLPVDTHVSRVSQRLGLTKNTDPVKIECDLCKLLPSRHWTLFSHLLIFHGRRVCKARKPLCENCTVADRCRHYAQEGAP